jgi:hypothetical protein
MVFAARLWIGVAARAVKARFPVSQVHAFDADFAAGGRGVDEFVVAQVDADVGEAAAQRVIEHQVARLQVLLVDFFAAAAQFGCRARNIDAPGVLENIPYQAAAIQAVFRVIAAVFIVNADHAHCADSQVRRPIGKLLEFAAGAARLRPHVDIGDIGSAGGTAQP